MKNPILITGPHGSGKTRILDAIMAARGSAISSERIEANVFMKLLEQIRHFSTENLPSIIAVENVQDEHQLALMRGVIIGLEAKWGEDCPLFVLVAQKENITPQPECYNIICTYHLYGQHD